MPWRHRTRGLLLASRRRIARLRIVGTGLLSDVEGPARGRRAALLAALRADGVSVAELRRAVDEHRLGPLALQRALLPEADRFTLTDVARDTGADPDEVARWFRALERPVTDDHRARVYTVTDLDIARRLHDYRALGLTDDDILPTARAVGRGIATVADAVSSVLAARLLATTADPDPEDALAYATEIRRLARRDGLHLSHLLALGLSERISSHLVALEEPGPDPATGTRPVAVAFADIVGFTDLGEHVGALELVDLADRLATTTTEAISPPVRLTKTIGDAVMLVSPAPDALVSAMIEIVSRWHEDPERPPLRAGIAWGPAIPRAGDWFGSPVNLASRITATARPRTILASADLHEVCTEALEARWTPAPTRRFKGIPGRHRLFRVQTPGGDARARPGS